MQNENVVEEKKLYQKGIDDLAKDIFPMEKIIKWFTDYYGKENEAVVRERLKNHPIMAPLHVKKFILAQALYKAKLSSVENLDEFLNNERTEESHFMHNADFFSIIEEGLTLFLEYLNPTQTDLKTKRRVLFGEPMVSALGFDYEELEKALKSGVKTPEMKEFLSFLRGSAEETYDTIEENYADYFIKYYNFGVTKKKEIGTWSFPYTSEDKKLKSPDQFEKDLSSQDFADLDAVDTWYLTDEQQEKLSGILSDKREFYTWSEEQIVASVNDAFGTNHKTIDDILYDYDTENIDALHNRLYYYKHKTDYYTLGENLTKEQKDNLSTLLKSKVDLYDLSNISNEYGEFIIETINDIFKTRHTTLQEVSSDPKLNMFFKLRMAFTDGINNIISHKLYAEEQSSNEQYLQQSEQRNRTEETQYAIDYFNNKHTTYYAIYNFYNACTMYRLEPLQISLSTIIHEFNHQMLYGSSYEENKKKFASVGKSLKEKGIGSPTVETINEFLSVRMMQSISTEDLKNYPLPISQQNGCAYTPAVKKFWSQLIKLEDTLKQCQVAGTYLPLEQRLGVDKLRKFDFAIRKYYREEITITSKKLDPDFETEFETELKNDPLALPNNPANTLSIETQKPTNAGLSL